MKIWDKGVPVDAPSTVIVNDFTKSEMFSKVPANVIAVPIVIPSSDGSNTPIIGLVDSKTLTNKVEVVKFPDVVITKTGLTIGSGTSIHTVPVVGLKAGEFIVASVKSATGGWAAFNPTCAADGVLTVQMNGPALVAGGFTCTLQLIALR